MPVTTVQSCEASSLPIVKLDGKEYTFDQLYNLYAPPVYGWIRKFVTDAAMADQVLVNTFLNGWKNRHQFPSSHFTPLRFLIHLSNKEIEIVLGKALFHERLSGFLKRRTKVVLKDENAAKELKSL